MLVGEESVVKIETRNANRDRQRIKIFVAGQVSVPHSLTF